MAAEEVPDGDPSARAVDVEKAILAQNGTVNPRYKAKLRSLSFNMRDSKNPDLRRRVLAGEISGALLDEVLIHLSCAGSCGTVWWATAM